MSAVPSDSATTKKLAATRAFNEGIDAALSAIDDRWRRLEKIRARTGNPAGVIETELRWIAATVSARRRA